MNHLRELLDQLNLDLIGYADHISEPLLLELLERLQLRSSMAKCIWLEDQPQVTAETRVAMPFDTIWLESPFRFGDSEYALMGLLAYKTDATSLVRVIAFIRMRGVWSLIFESPCVDLDTMELMVDADTPSHIKRMVNIYGFRFFGLLVGLTSGCIQLVKSHYAPELQHARAAAKLAPLFDFSVAVNTSCKTACGLVP